MNDATYRVLAVRWDKVFIVDEDRGKSVTNDAERVVSELAGRYGKNPRFIYRDTMGEWGELVHNGARFIGFKPYAEDVPDWRPIRTAPKDATWIQVRMEDGTIHRAHWASNLSGEEQPPFEGWFVDRKTHFLGIHEPKEWKPL